MPFIVATYVYASSQGQRTHSARTNCKNKPGIKIHIFIYFLICLDFQVTLSFVQEYAPPYLAIDQPNKGDTHIFTCACSGGLHMLKLLPIIICSLDLSEKVQTPKFNVFTHWLDATQDWKSMHVLAIVRTLFIPHKTIYVEAKK